MKRDEKRRTFQYESSLVVIPIKNNYVMIFHFVKLLSVTSERLRQRFCAENKYYYITKPVIQRLDY